MPQKPQPLDLHQQELINIVKSAHHNLAVARKVRLTELARRNAAEKLRIEQEVAAALEASLIRTKQALDEEITAHEVALDDSLIAAYDSGIPVRRIALDGFGNRYEGGVHQLLIKLRADGRLGNRTGYQGRQEDDFVEVAFPKPINITEILNEATTLAAPTYTALPEPLVLVHPDENGNDGISVPAVRLEMDARDPWFKQIAKNAREGTPFKNATYCTLYLHPATGELTAVESKEKGAVTWDHPVARRIKAFPDETLAGFNAALEASE